MKAAATARVVSADPPAEVVPAVAAAAAAPACKWEESEECGGGNCGSARLHITE